MKVNEIVTKQLLLEVSDIETALSEHYGKDVKISDVSLRIWLYCDGQCIDWIDFSIDEEEWLSDSDLWGEETFEEYFPTIHVPLDDYDEKEIYKQLFDFDAESAFKSIDWSLS